MTILTSQSVAATKSLQSCPTLCDPRDGSPPGSPVPGILQARTLEWVAICFSNTWKWKVKVKLLSRVWLLATPWIAAYQAPGSMLLSGNLEILNIYKHKHSGIFALSLSFSKIHFLFLLLWPFKNLSSLLWNFILFCHPFQRVAYFYICFSSVQSLSRVQLCDPMNCSMTGLPVHHQLPEFTQIHVHWVGDAIQPSHPLSSPLLQGIINPKLLII